MNRGEQSSPRGFLGLRGAGTTAWPRQADVGLRWHGRVLRDAPRQHMAKALRGWIGDRTI